MKRLLLFLAVLVVVLAVGVQRAESYAYFSIAQNIAVTGGGWSFTRVVDHNLNTILVNGTDHYQNYTQAYSENTYNHWYGAYIYDYTNAKFDNLRYIWVQDL